MQELECYENEKQRLIARIAVLEKVEKERDELLELLRIKTLGKVYSNHSASLQAILEFK